MSSLKLKTPSGGSVSFNATDTANDVTLTVPASNATLLTSTGDGSTLTNLPAPDALTTASGSAPSYSARAWVLFDGTGTVAITESGNVSSITDNGAGLYWVNFTTAMPDANFAAVASSGDPNYGTNNLALFTHTRTTTQVKIKCTASNGSEYDIDEISVIVMR